MFILICRMMSTSMGKPYSLVQVKRIALPKVKPLL